MSPLRSASAPERSSRGIGLGVAQPHRLEHGRREGRARLERREHEAERSADAALDAPHAVAALDQLAERVDHGQARAHRRLVAQSPAGRGRGAQQATVRRGGAGERLLVGEHQVEALLDGREQQVAGLLGREVHEHRPRHRVRRDLVERLARRRPPAPQLARAGRLCPCPPPASAGARARCRAGRTRSPSGRAPRRCGSVPSRERPAIVASARPTRPKPSSTTSVRRLAGTAAADLGELELRVDAARGLARLLLLDDEGDVELGGALRDRDHVDAARRQRREDARRDAGCPGHAAADDGDHGQAAPRVDAVHEPRGELVRERRLERGLAPAPPRPPAA